MLVRLTRPITTVRCQSLLIAGWLLSVVLISIPVAGQSTDYQVRQLTVDEGMPSNRVSTVAQDHNGFMWFGTDEGLARYDGHEVKTYRFDPEDSTSLSNNFAEITYVDSEGTLWVGTYGGGLNKYDVTTDSFIRYDHDPDNPNSISHNVVTGLYEDRSGILWIGSRNGHIDALDKSTDTITHHLGDHAGQSLYPFQVWSFLEDQQGYLWAAFGNPGGNNREGVLLRFSQDRSTYKTYDPMSFDVSSMADNRVMTLFEDSAGQLWVGGRNGSLFKYEQGADRLSIQPRPGDIVEATWVMDIDQDTEGAFQVSYFMHGLEQREYSPGANAKNSTTILPYSSVFRTTTARDGSIWAGTLSYGVFALLPKPNAFQLVDTTPGGNFIQDKNEQLWLATNTQGLFKYDTKSGITTPYPPMPSDGTGPNHPWVVDLDLDKEGNLWMTTRGGGLNKLNLSTNTFSYFVPGPANSDTPISRDMGGLSVDHDRDIISIMSVSGLVKFDMATERFSIVEHVSDIRSFASHTYEIMYRDSDGGLWLAGQTYASQEQSGMFHIAQDDYHHHLNNITVTGFAEDLHGRFLIGTERGLYAREDSTFSLLLPSSRLNNYGIKTIIVDHEGYIWLTTEQALWRYDADAKEVIQLTRQDGYVPELGRYVFKTEKGEIIFSGPPGILRLDPSKIETNSLPPQVSITGIKAFNKPVTTNAAINNSFATPLSLTHSQNELTFDFAALHYKNPDQNTHQYKLDPYEEEWVTSGEDRSIRYTNLDPKTYTFSVRAANSDGVWSDPVSVVLTIHPPWWRTVWAYVIYGFLFVAGMFVVNRVQQRRAAAKERLQVEREKAVEIASMNAELQQALVHLRDTQDQLIQTEKLASLGQLTAGIAHEIKNPLNFVNNFSKLSEEALDELEEYQSENRPLKDDDVNHLLSTLKTNAKKIYQHGQRADGIIRSMLDHSRTKPGKRQSTDINELLDEYVNLAYHTWQAKLNEKEVAPYPPIHRTYGDCGEVELVPQEIGRVFINLLDNAFYAVGEKSEVRSPKSGGVRVSTKMNGRFVEIRIKDTGVGIPKGLHQKIFEPFFTTKPAGSGTGLGLSLSHDIVVKGHGGELTVESTEGEGAEFVVRLPT